VAKKKQVFSVVKTVKANARERVGTPPAGRTLPDPKRKTTTTPKYVETLGDLLHTKDE
jgi:hypothetical protein